MCPVSDTASSDCSDVTDEAVPASAVSDTERPEPMRQPMTTVSLALRPNTSGA